MNELVARIRAAERPGVYVPQYGSDVVLRIWRARIAAITNDFRHAWKVDEGQYYVFSSKAAGGKARPERYILDVSTDPHHGGFVYVMGFENPIVFIRCTCPAFAEHKFPCWHGAKVYLRLMREAKKSKEA